MARKRKPVADDDSPEDKEPQTEKLVKKTSTRSKRKATEQNNTEELSKRKKSKEKKIDSEENSEVSPNDDSTINYDKKDSWKIVSWNINGIRAWLPKAGLDYVEKEAPDVFCVQETKCSDSKLPAELKDLKEYNSYFLAGDREGYSGVGVLSKREPLNVTYGIGLEKHDAEGRVITLEFDDFFIVNAYVPNAGRGLVRLDYRMSWDLDFRKYLCDLKNKKGVILTGDLNVAHNEIDLKNPKTNKRNAGFTQEERDGFTALLDQGFIDSFRKLYPDREGAYTFWTYMMNARAKNVGWRLDYFVVSEDLIDKVIDNEIRDKVMGSDHCPIVLHLK